MTWGTGVVLMIVGAILATDAIRLPQVVTDSVSTDVVGIILLAVGVLAVVLGVVQSRQSRR